MNLKEDDLKVDFEGANTLKNLLGFNKPYISGIGLHEGTQLVNITPLNSILVNCSVIEGSYLNGEQKPILFAFTPNVPPGYRIGENIFSPVILPISIHTLDNINIRLTDQNMNEINVRGEEVTVRLEIRSIY